MKEFDYVIVGSGLFGAVFAHEMKKLGKRCLVVEKRSHHGGNTYCEQIEGIQVHNYGAHIFHTSDKRIWDYVNSFVEFNNYINSPLANYKGELYNLPFNMNTFYQLWKVTTPEEAQQIIAKQVKAAGITDPQNLEEQAIALVGTDVYEKLIKGYSEKHWEKKCHELPASIIKRLPVRFTFNNNYFNDRYQGIPLGGYNKLIDALLNGVEVRLNVDFFKHKEELLALSDKIVYSGRLDEYYDYRFGKLAYKSLRFEHKVLDQPNFQGNAVINHTDKDVPYLRTIEHKHFEFGTQPKTVITYEYPQPYDLDKEPYYPLNDAENNAISKQYKELAEKETYVIFGGRLAEYQYYDMHQVIGSALAKVKSELSSVGS
jgi:UDP-galactopyranose mutase